jgi:hypothetical protein
VNAASSPDPACFAYPHPLAKYDELHADSASRLMRLRGAGSLRRPIPTSSTKQKKKVTGASTAPAATTPATAATPPVKPAP